MCGGEERNADGERDGNVRHDDDGGCDGGSDRAPDRNGSARRHGGKSVPQNAFCAFARFRAFFFCGRSRVCGLVFGEFILFPIRRTLLHVAGGEFVHRMGIVVVKRRFAVVFLRFEMPVGVVYGIVIVFVASFHDQSLGCDKFMLRNRSDRRRRYLLKALFALPRKRTRLSFAFWSRRRIRWVG